VAPDNIEMYRKFSRYYSAETSITASIERASKG
jgi:hypothetical protein